MKNIFLFILLAVFFITACNEDEFLKESPKDAIFPENVYTNLEGFKMARNGLLALFRLERTNEAGNNGEMGGFLWKIGTDNMRHGWSGGNVRPLGGYYNLTSTSAVCQSGFEYYFRIVNSANLMLSRAQNPDVDWESSDPAIAEQNKNEMMAYAHFARGWAYYFLVNGWGEVPISTEEINGTNYRNDWTREPVLKVKKFIISDFRAAEPYLADDSSDPQTLSKAVCQHYLAEVYLSLYNDDNSYTTGIDSAKYFAEKVVNNANYTLITERYGVNKNESGVPFMDQFVDGNVQPSQGNTEVLWWFVNKVEEDYKGIYSNIMRRGWIPSYWKGFKGVEILPEWGGRGVNRMGVTPWALSLYEPQDDRFSEYAIRKYYITGDPKTSTDTVWTTFEEPDGYNWISQDHKLASTRKWDWSFDDPAKYTSANQYDDQPYLRLSETYLLLAEILMDANDKEGAAEWINKVRVRSHATPITASDVTLDYILDERSRELLTEEHRRITLNRVGKLVERARLHNPQTYVPYPPGIQDYHSLLPIPQNVIDGNTAKEMKNNPGY